MLVFKSLVVVMGICRPGPGLVLSTSHSWLQLSARRHLCEGSLRYLYLWEVSVRNRELSCGRWAPG